MIVQDAGRGWRVLDDPSISFDARSMSKNASWFSFYDRSFADDGGDVPRPQAVQGSHHEAWKRRGSSAKFAEFWSSAFKPLFQEIRASGGEAQRPYR
jgi:hypothetical protein